MQALTTAIVKSEAVDFGYLKNKLNKYLAWSFKHHSKQESIQRCLCSLVYLIQQKIIGLKMESMCSGFNFLLSQYQLVLNQ